MKRRDDNRQLSKDELENQDDDEPEEAGSYSKASAEVMAQRKIIKVKRKSENSFTSVPSSNPFANFSGIAPEPSSSIPVNPFANFSGMTPAVKSSVPTNPFANFSALTTPAQSSKSSVDHTLPAPVIPKVQNKNIEQDEKPNLKSGSSKIEKLNKSFSDWLKKQQQQHALSIWRDGLQDYIKYAEKIAEESSNDVSVAPSASVKPTTSISDASDRSIRTGDSKPFESSSNTDSNKSAFSFQADNSKAPTAAPSNSDISKTGFTFQPLSGADNSKVSLTPANADNSKTGFTFQPLLGADNSKASMTPANADNSKTGFTFQPFTFSGGSSFQAPSTDKPFDATIVQPFQPSGLFGSSKLGEFTGLGTTGLAAASNAAEDENEGDDEGAPLLEPEKVMKNADDTDEVLLEVDSKYFRFNKKNNEWSDCGKGIFRVTKDTITSKKRMLLRNLTGKIMMNAAFHPGISFSKLGKSGIKFLAVIDSDGDLKMIMVKVKPEHLESTLAFLNSCAK